MEFIYLDNKPLDLHQQACLHCVPGKEQIGKEGLLCSSRRKQPLTFFISQLLILQHLKANFRDSICRHCSKHLYVLNVLVNWDVDLKLHLSLKKYFRFTQLKCISENKLVFKDIFIQK